MKISAGRFSFTGRLCLLLVLTFILTGFMSVTVLHAGGAKFTWAKNMGGTSFDSGNSIAVDSLGNIYTTGYFSDTVDFDPGAGTSNLTSAGGGDIFVCKLDNQGSFVWARAMGGTLSDGGLSIAVDSSGNVYTTGYFTGTSDFDPGPLISNLVSAGSSDIFINKLDSSGNFVWAIAFGNTFNDSGRGIAVDSSGNVYTAGSFQGTVDFDPGLEISNLVSGGASDIFVSKLDTNGNFLWAGAMGGTSNDLAFGIFLDSSGNVFTTGYFLLTADFDPGPGTSNLTSAGGDDIFVSKLDTNGNFVWARAMGGTSGDNGYGIGVDPSGNVYSTGSFQGIADFNPGPGTFNLISEGGEDIYISKLDSSGNFVWAKAIGGTSYANIAVDSSGNVYTTGYFTGTADFDPGPGTFNLISAGSEDIYISKLNSSGSFVWAKGMGGILYDEAFGISLDASGNIYTTGLFQDTVDFDPDTGTFNLTSAGSEDIYISKLTGAFSWPMYLPAIINNKQR